MIKVYAVVLAAGAAALIGLILGGALTTNRGPADRHHRSRHGIKPKMAVGAALGLGMGGMAAEFSPIDLTWQVSVIIAIVAAALSATWVRYALRQADRA